MDAMTLLEIVTGPALHPLTIDLDAHKVYDQEVEGVELTHTEFENLWFNRITLNFTPVDLHDIFCAHRMLTTNLFSVYATVGLGDFRGITIADDDVSHKPEATIIVHEGWITLRFSSKNDDDAEFFKLIIQFDTPRFAYGVNHE